MASTMMRVYARDLVAGDSWSYQGGDAARIEGRLVAMPIRSVAQLIATAGVVADPTYAATLIGYLGMTVNGKSFGEYLDAEEVVLLLCGCPGKISPRPVVASEPLIPLDRSVSDDAASRTLGLARR